MEETLLEAYGADGHRGSAKERVKLQSEMDRAQTQVHICSTEDGQYGHEMVKISAKQYIT